MKVQNIHRPEYYTYASSGKPVFRGQAPVERLAKDTYVGVRNFLIQETAFFREPVTLEFVKNYIKSELKNKPEINIIDGACSKGYETYTLAMMLDKIDKKINITGFDLGKNAIDEARAGKFIIEDVKGNEDLVDIYKMGYAAYSDNYLAFPGNLPLKPEQEEYRNLFNEFFTQIPYKKDFSLVYAFKRLFFKKYVPVIETKMFKIKPEKAGTCKFVQGDILKLDEIVPEHSADVLLFRNALYHLTTSEYGMSFKVPLSDDFIIPAVENVVMQVDKAVAKNGIFVIGQHSNDHELTTGKTLYAELKKCNFEPVFTNNDGSIAIVWRKK